MSEKYFTSNSRTSDLRDNKTKQTGSLHIDDQSNDNDGSSLNESLTSIDWLPRLNVGKTREDGKPTCSYASLITLAIKSAVGEEKKLTLAEIYDWIQENYPYFQTAEKGWKNSVRHNLSLNKMFKKIVRDPADHGKGCYWALNDKYDPEIDGSKTNRKRRKNTDQLSVSGESPAKRMDDRRAFSSSSAPLQSSISHMSSDSIPTSVFNYDLQTNSVLGHIINPSFASDQKRRNNGNPQLNLPSQHQPGQIILINYFWALSLSPTAAQYPTTKIYIATLVYLSVHLVDTGLENLNTSLSAYQDLNSSFNKLYSSLVREATTTTEQSSQPMLTFEAVQDVLSNLETNPSLDQALFRRTQDLARNVANDLSTSGNWLLSSHFPGLAQSFNDLIQSSNNPFASIDLSTLPLQVSTDLFNVEEEEEFDWDTLPM
eukprot:gene3927-6399_t